MLIEIYNQSQGTYLAWNASIAGSFFKRLKGLLGKNSLGVGQGLIIYPCNSIHTMGMRFPIDVLFLNCQGRVVKLVHCLKPFRICGLFKYAKFVIELPEGCVRKSCTDVGDLILIRNHFRWK